MASLERLGWVAEEEFDIFGFQFALRSTSARLLSDIADHLLTFRIRSPEPIWPVYSLVAPADPSPKARIRQLFIGYCDGSEAFRYPEMEQATRALFASLHCIGFGPRGEHQIVLQASALAVGQSGILVCGPHRRKRAAALAERLGATVLAEDLTLVDMRSGILGWPFSITEWPHGTDRRGIPFAPLGTLAVKIGASFEPMVVVTTDRGDLDRPRVAAELMRFAHSAVDRPLLFRGLMSLLSSVRVVSAWRRMTSQIALDIAGHLG